MACVGKPLGERQRLMLPASPTAAKIYLKDFHDVAGALRFSSRAARGSITNPRAVLQFSAAMLIFLVCFGCFCHEDHCPHQHAQ